VPGGEKGFHDRADREAAENRALILRDNLDEKARQSG
jgi:hypothetical protein